MPRGKEKFRDPASVALIELRQALNKTQRDFAAEFLHTTATTVARYETHSPPRGDVLLQLADIAKQEADSPRIKLSRRMQLQEISETFESLYINNSRERLDPNKHVWTSHGLDRYALLFRRMTGSREIAAGMYCSLILDVIASDYKTVSDKYFKALKDLAIKSRVELGKAIGSEDQLLQLPEEDS